MAPSHPGLLRSSAPDGAELAGDFDDSLVRQATFSTSLARIFRGRFCDFILPNRAVTIFNKHQVIYDMGDAERTLFFLQKGFVKVGAVSTGGREVIYDVRKEGDVVGELCATEHIRPDRAVALEDTSAIAVPFDEIVKLLLTKPDLITTLVDVLCRALKEAYEQVNTLATDDTVHRLIKVLVGLARKLGKSNGKLVEIPTYLTQEEIAQMVAGRRERISTALNSLRRQGLVNYSTRGHLVLDVSALESHPA